MPDTEYAMFAETLTEVGEFLKEACINLNSLSVYFAGIGCFEVRFSGSRPLSFYRRMIGGIPDAHVMLESLNHATDYTGDRYYRHD